ncbi:MAG TPA: winged helix-turn-helix domain-containing protein [Pyrinomonadaceae bacterium]|jgi:DNA-binding winged helix-turn-helix (wHTH) protein
MDSHDHEPPDTREPNDRKQSLHVYEFGDFRLDTRNTTSHRLLLNGQPFRIQNKQFCLLSILIENRERELNNEELIRRVWSDEVVDESNREYFLGRLHAQLRLLRSRVGKDTIAFKKGVGYYFAAPVKIVAVPPTPDLSYPDLEFNQWIFRSRECWRTKVFLGLGVLLSLLYCLYYFLTLFVPAYKLSGPDPRVALCFLQFIVVGGGLIASYFVFDRNVKDFPAHPEADAALMRVSDYTDPEKWREAKVGAKSSLKQYSRYWKWLLGAWTMLYLLLTLTMIYTPPSGPLSSEVESNPLHPLWVLSIASTIFNNCNSLAIALCFVVLNLPTVLRGAEENTGLAGVTKRIIKWGLVAIVMFALLESLLIFFPPPQWFNWMTRSKLVWSLDLISGLVGAITLALFVGRIQSKFLGPSTWLPLALYFYVAIQSLYMVILEKEKSGVLMIEAALILKCLLYLYVSWLFKSGRLLFYLVRVKTVYERVNIEWLEFLANLNRKQ